MLPELKYYRCLKNYQYYCGGFLTIAIVKWAPKPYSNLNAAPPASACRRPAGAGQAEAGGGRAEKNSKMKGGGREHETLSKMPGPVASADY